MGVTLIETGAGTSDGEDGTKDDTESGVGVDTAVTVTVYCAVTVTVSWGGQVAPVADPPRAIFPVDVPPRAAFSNDVLGVVSVMKTVEVLNDVVVVVGSAMLAAFAALSDVTGEDVARTIEVRVS